jgi:hypothetical protein
MFGKQLCLVILVHPKGLIYVKSAIKYQVLAVVIFAYNLPKL